MALVPDFMIRAAARFGPTRSLLQWHWSRYSLWEVERRFGTPHWIETYMRTCFTYRHDRLVHGMEDHWQTPQSTFQRKTGDCEDYALFANHVLGARGYESNVFAAFTEDDGHAVCLVRERGVYYTLANEGMRRVGRAGSARDEATRKEVAWQAADRIYPGRWRSCAWVVELAPDGNGDPEAVIPVFDWVEPRRPSRAARRGSVRT